MNDKERDGLVFYKSHYQAIKDLKDEQLGKLFRAVFEKQLGNEVVLADDIKIAFNFINNQLVVDEKKYNEKCERARANGKRGGAPKGNTNASKQPKQPKTSKTSLKEKDNEKEKEKDNEKDNKLNIALEKFIEMRKKIKKPLTEYGLELIKSKLDKLADNDDDKIKILNNSIMKCWQGVFPLDDNEKTNIMDNAKDVEDYSQLEWNEEHPLYDFAKDNGGYEDAKIKYPDKPICKGDDRFG